MYKAEFGPFGFFLIKLIGYWAVLSLIFAQDLFATELGKSLTTVVTSALKKEFPAMTNAKAISVADPITEKSPNTVVWEVFDKKKKRLGFARDIQTTTGCNLYCLPLHFVLILDAKKNYKALVELDALTKKNHAPFNEEDRLKLNLILAAPPPSFKRASEPLDLVDAITRETKLEYRGDVVEEAALTSYRTYQYLKQTQNVLK